MRKYLLSIALFVMTITTMTSCLGEGDSYTYYNDAAISAFKLGTLNRYFHKTKADGTDSIYKRTLDCSGYVFYIDNNNGVIWNGDSLPMEIDASKVICTITAVNSGTVALKSLTADSLSWYSSSDSIDFSEPRLFRVFSNSGAGSRDYTIHVNVHKEKADTCIWTRMLSGNASIGALTDLKALSDGSRIYLFGVAGTSAKLFTTAVADGRAWNEVDVAAALTPDGARNVVMKGGSIYAVSGGAVVSSNDGATWSTVATTDMRRLVAASSSRLYALSADNRLMSSKDNGVSWTAEALDEDAALLPTEDIAYTCRALRTNENSEKLVIIGNRNADTYSSDTTAVVWAKVEENDEGARAGQWNYVAFAGDNKWKAPKARNWHAVNYDNGNIKAIAGSSADGKTKALQQIFHSGDDGITWRNDSVMSLPADINSSETTFTMVADGVNSVWVICGGTGQVWKGRINRVAWKQEDKYFEE